MQRTGIRLAFEMLPSKTFTSTSLRNLTKALFRLPPTPVAEAGSSSVAHQKAYLPVKDGTRPVVVPEFSVMPSVFVCVNATALKPFAKVDVGVLSALHPPDVDLSTIPGSCVLEEASTKAFHWVRVGKLQPSGQASLACAQVNFAAALGTPVTASGLSEVLLVAKRELSRFFAIQT